MPSSTPSTSEPYFQIYTKYNGFRYDTWHEVTADWRQWYEETIKCRDCNWPRAELQEHPQPTEIIAVDAALKGVTPVVWGSFTHCVSNDLLEVLGPYLPRSVVLGPIYSLATGSPQMLPFQSVQVPRAEWVIQYRGLREPVFYQCPGCGHTYYPNSEGEAFLQRYVENRPIVVSHRGDMFIRGSLAEELRLRARFEDLRLAKIPVLKKPRDRWTLPGDPGWDGVLRTPEGEIAPLAPYLRERKGQ